MWFIRSQLNKRVAGADIASTAGEFGRPVAFTREPRLGVESLQRTTDAVNRRGGERSSFDVDGLGSAAQSRSHSINQKALRHRMVGDQQLILLDSLSGTNLFQAAEGVRRYLDWLDHACEFLDSSRSAGELEELCVRWQAERSSCLFKHNSS